jgi:myosin heavy subunit
MKGEVKAGKFNSVTTSTELLKVLSRICILEEQHDSTISTTSSLRVQLDQALAHVQELELAQNAAHKEIESLTKKLANVKSSWKIEQNKLQLVVQSLKEEVETEQKARTRVEVANQKMTKELLDANMAVAKVVQELERERKAHELMEDVCDELAREISDDKAEVEDLKRDSIKMHEELEEERRMLQLAEVWREERVQMKLGEAKLLLEEKGAALDVLRSELEKFLWAGRLRNRGDFVQEAEVLHNVVAAFHPREIVASYPPVESSQPENDLLDISCDKQTERHYSPCKDNILDAPNCGNRWTGDSGLIREGDTEHQPRMSLISPVNDIQRRTLKQLQAGETKDGDGCKYERLSRSSQASKYGDSVEAVAYEKSYLEVNDNDDDNDPLYQHNEDSSDGVVHQASEIDDEDHHQLYEEVETVGGMKQPGEVAWKVHGMEDTRVTPLREKKNYGQEDAVNEINLHGHTQEVEWETVPQQSSWISRNNPHIERGMKGHVLWPKGFMDAAIKKEKSILN